MAQKPAKMQQKSNSGNDGANNSKASGAAEGAAAAGNAAASQPAPMAVTLGNAPRPVRPSAAADTTMSETDTL